MTEVLPIKQELLIDGAWVDVTATPHGTLGGSEGIDILRGSSSEQATIGADIAAFKLDNTDGRYANRNPMSPYYGLLPQWTPYRCSLEHDEGASLRLTDTNLIDSDTYDGARAWTADKASLDITGDLDVRIDCQADDWYGRNGHVLAGKYVSTGNQRSWCFASDNRGRLMFMWTTDGTTGTRTIAYSTDSVPARGRVALRAVIDVNTGSGCSVTFYTGTGGVSGSWTQLGSVVTGPLTTSVYSSSAPLEVGHVNNGGIRQFFGSGINAEPFCGKIYDFSLRNSAGTEVARMNANGQAAGTASWSDGLTAPNTWILEASAEISGADYRFHGEVPEFPVEWDPTGNYVIVNVSASSIVERLTSGQKPLESPIKRNLKRYSSDGYWPMEDSFGATSIGATVGRTGYMKDAAFGAASELPGAAGALAFTSDDGYASANCEPRSSNTGVSCMIFYFRFDTVPASAKQIFSFYQKTGSIYAVRVDVTATTYTLNIVDSANSSLLTSNTTFGTYGTPNQWIAMRVLLTQNGGNVDWAWAWYSVDAPVTHGVSGSFAGTVGRPTSWISWPFTDKSDLQIGHVILSRTDLQFGSYAFVASTNGYARETARDRAMRIAAEEGIPFWWIGPDTTDGEVQSAFMGAQGLLAPIDLFQECASTDGGILFAPRDKLGLAIRSGYSLLNRDGPEVSYTSKHLSGRLLPRENRDIRNDVTITRNGGSFGRYEKTEGANNTHPRSEDPEGVGTFDVSIPRSAAFDSQLVPLAQREVMFGTWDELRFSQVEINLRRADVASIVADVNDLDIGRPFVLTGLPLYAGGPEDLAQLVRGYRETLSNQPRTIVFNTSPYGPYQTGTWGARRWATRTTVLSAPRSSGQTNLHFLTSDEREVWSTTATPYDIMIAGERMTVTAMGAPGDLTYNDGTFESGITGWSGTGGTLSWSSAQAQTGTRSALVTVSGGPSQAYIRPSSTSFAPRVFDDRGYTARGWIRSSAALSTGGVSVDWFDIDVNYLTTSFSGGAVAANTWTQFSVTATPPANAYYASYGMTAAGSPPNGTLIYFDNVTFFAATGNGGQRATVTRAVNSIAKTVPRGSAVKIFQPLRWSPDVRG